MRGVVFHGERDLEIMNFPDPTPGPGEVVVEMKASGMCGSDLHQYRRPKATGGANATGLPPKAYLAQLRAERAAVLLLHSDDPSTGIGRAVGWPDQNYFARRFKAHYGLSATTYRRQFATRAAEDPPPRHVTLTGLGQPGAAAAQAL